MRVWGVAFLVVLAAGCGGSSKQSIPKQPPPALAQRCGEDAQGVDAKQVWFRASDGALLDGAEVGDGDVGVVLAHESPSDLCPWLPFAKTLADHGYRAFAFDFRGSGSSPAQFGAKATRTTSTWWRPPRSCAAWARRRSSLSAAPSAGRPYWLRRRRSTRGRPE